MEKDEYLDKARLIRDKYGEKLDNLKDRHVKPVYYDNWVVRVFVIADKICQISFSTK